MVPETSPRFNWRMHPRPTPRPEEPVPPIFQSFAHDVYGQPLGISPWADAGDHFGEGLLFQGLQHDRDSAWFDRPRAMSPAVAKWIDQEPLGYEDGMNHYIVEGDNPINAVNPLGT
jgi:RHS repeat-associated protein